MIKTRQTNLFLVGRDTERCASMADTFTDEYPDIRVWRFRCIVDAGGALLRCRASAIPDAVILADPFDDWTRTRLWECVTTRRELTAVPAFVYSSPDFTSHSRKPRNMTHVDWRELSEPRSHEDLAADARKIAKVTRAEPGWAESDVSPRSPLCAEGRWG